MVLVGSSEVSGSWKIIAISLPRTRRSSSSLRPTSSRSLSLTEPPTMDPPGGSSPMIDRPVMDLPQPDSPTMPRVSPASTCRSMFPTACTTELVSLMCVDRSWMSRTGAMRPLPLVIGGFLTDHPAPRGALLTASESHVHRVTQSVTDEVQRHHGQDDACAYRVDEPPVTGLQGVAAVGELVTPVDVREVQAEAEEADVGDGQDRVGHLERHVDDDHAEGVRDQVPADQPPAVGPGRSRRQDEVAFSQREHLAADQPGRHLPGEEADDQAQRQHGRAELDRQDQDHEQERDREEDVDDAHHGRVDEPADQSGYGAEQRADHDGDERGEEPDLQGGLAALHDPAELVEPGAVGAEQVLGRGRLVRLAEVGGQLVGVVDERPDEAEEHEEDEYGEADHGQPVARELAQREPPPALDRADLAALGGALHIQRRQR